jgi:hypothetical protein
MAANDQLVIRILQQLVMTRPPNAKTLSKHLHGLRAREYYESLPSYQVFAELAG